MRYLKKTSRLRKRDTTDLCQGHKGCAVEKEESFQQMVLDQLDIHMQKNEHGPSLHTKVAHRLKHNTLNYKSSRKKNGIKSL